jgi:hypothetical protein
MTSVNLVIGILQYNIGISTMKHMIEAYKTYDTLQYISPNDIIKSYELLFELVVYCIKEKQVDGYEIDDWVIGMINETIDTAFDVIRYEKGDAYLNMLGGELEITDGMEIDDLIDRALSTITIEAGSSTNTNTKCSPCGCSIC